VTIRLASDGPQTVRADTIGAAWLAVAGRILNHPGPADEIIATHAEPERLAWMHANLPHRQVTRRSAGDRRISRRQW
jgi:hypothetical protein